MPIGESKRCLWATALNIAVLFACAVLGNQQMAAAQQVEADDLGHVGFGLPQVSTDQSAGKGSGTTNRAQLPAPYQRSAPHRHFPGLTQKDLETIRSLPPACQADLPGLDFQKPTDDNRGQVRLASATSIIDAETVSYTHLTLPTIYSV